MAITRCGHCQATRFEIKTIEPTGSAYKLISVQCASCGVPIGVTNYFDVGSIVKGNEKILKSLETKVRNMEATLATILTRVRR